MRLLGFLRPYRASLLVSSALAIGSQVAGILVPVVTGRVIDELEGDQSTRVLAVAIGIILLLGAVRAALMVGRRLLSGRQALGVEYDLRDELYSHFLRLSFGFYDRSQTGQLMSRATIDLQSVRFCLGYGLIFFAQHIVTIVVVTVVLFFYSWELALVALAITPAIVVVAARYSRVSHPVLRDVQQKLADVSTVAEESIVGVHVVKAFAQEERRQTQFERASGSVFDATVHAFRQRALYVPLLSFLPMLSQAAVLLEASREIHGRDVERVEETQVARRIVVVVDLIHDGVLRALGALGRGRAVGVTAAGESGKGKGRDEKDGDRARVDHGFGAFGDPCTLVL